MEKDLIELLKDEHCTLAIRSGNQVQKWSGHGVKDLLGIVENQDDFLKGASVADRAIGKAAAALMIWGGVKEVYTPLISSPAVKLFEKYKTPYEAVKEVPLILNRTKEDTCPLERRCKDADDLQEIKEIIRLFIEEMMSKGK